MSQQLTLNLSDALYEMLQEKANAAGQSLADWIVLSLQKECEIDKNSDDISNLIPQDSECQVWSPYNAREAAAIMLDVLKETESQDDD